MARLWAELVRAGSKIEPNVQVPDQDKGMQVDSDPGKHLCKVMDAVAPASISEGLCRKTIRIGLQHCKHILLGADVPAMLPTMVRLPGQSRSAVQLLPPPSDLRNPLTTVELARSVEVHGC